LILLLAGGLAGYGGWRAHQPETESVDTTAAQRCDLCAAAKRDLAEQVRERNQQKE